MYTSTRILISLSLLILAACTSQQSKEQPALAPSPPTTPVPTTSAQVPPLTELKDGKQLNIVRIMDGAACKNELQGVKGTFLVYADPADIERIKREKGPKIFADFEIKIQNLATEALQKASDATNFDEDPFALGADAVHQKLADQLNTNFQQTINTSLKRFHQETTLFIDVTAFTPSLIFYQKGCEATQLEPDEQQQ